MPFCLILATARPGRQYPGWPCFLWDTPSDRPSRSLRVVPADFRPGTVPAHPGPAHRRTSVVAFQVPGELGGGGPGCRGLGRGGSSSPSSSGTCGPPYRSPRITDSVPHAVAPIAYPTAFLVQQPAMVARQIGSLPGCGYRWMSPTHLLSRACRRRESRLTRSGREPRGPAAGGGGAGSFRRGCAAWRALGAHGRVRTASRSTRPRPRGRRAAVMRRYPQGSVRGTGLSPDEKGQSASSGSSRRHPARRLVVARPPGTPAPLAHQYRPGSCAPGGDMVSYPGSHFCTPLREVRRCFSQAARPTTPGAADSRARSPPGPGPTRCGNPPHPWAAE